MICPKNRVHSDFVDLNSICVFMALYINSAEPQTIAGKKKNTINPPADVLLVIKLKIITR